MARSFTLETDDAKGVFEMIQRALCGEVIVPWERPQPRLKKDALK